MTNSPATDITDPRLHQAITEIEGLITSRCLATPHRKSTSLDVQLTRRTWTGSYRHTNCREALTISNKAEIINLSVGNSSPAVLPPCPETLASTHHSSAV